MNCVKKKKTSPFHDLHHWTQTNVDSFATELSAKLFTIFPEQRAIESRAESDETGSPSMYF